MIDSEKKVARTCVTLGEVFVLLRNSAVHGSRGDSVRTERIWTSSEPLLLHTETESVMFVFM